MTYYTQNPFNYCHPSFVTIDERTGRIFQSENTGKEYRFNMEDYLNEKYQNASPKFGSEICEVASPSLCGGFKTGLKVSFDDWLAGLDQANTWSEFPEQRAEFQKAYEALQAEEKKKQRKAPPAAQKTRLAYTSPWQAVINWARGATGGSTPAAPINKVLPPVTINPTPSPTNPNRPLPPTSPTGPSKNPWDDLVGGGSKAGPVGGGGTDSSPTPTPSPVPTPPSGGGGGSGGSSGSDETEDEGESFPQNPPTGGGGLGGGGGFGGGGGGFGGFGGI